jgi:hypothetical protein
MYVSRETFVSVLARRGSWVRASGGSQAGFKEPSPNLSLVRERDWEASQV